MSLVVGIGLYPPWVREVEADVVFGIIGDTPGHDVVLIVVVHLHPTVWFAAVQPLPFPIPFRSVGSSEEEDALSLEARQVDLEAPLARLGLSDEEVALVEGIDELRMHADILLHSACLHISPRSQPLLLLKVVAIVIACLEAQLVIVGIIPRVALLREDSVPSVAYGADIASPLVDGAEVPCHILLPVACEVPVFERRRAAVGIYEGHVLLLAERGRLLSHKALVVGQHLVVEVFLHPEAVDRAGYDLRMLGGMRQLEHPRNGHLLPVEAPPALCHHQQVECAAVLLVVALEEVIGLWHEAFDFRCQEHLGHDISAVEGIVGVHGVAHRERDGLPGHQMGRRHVEIDALERLILLFGARELQRRFAHVGPRDEEEAVGIDMTYAVEDGHLIDASAPALLTVTGRQLNDLADTITLQRRKMLQTALVHHRESERRAPRLAGYGDVKIPLSRRAVEPRLQRHALGLDAFDFLAYSLRTLRAPWLLRRRKYCLVILTLLGREGERAAPAVLSRHGLYDLAAVVRYRHALFPRPKRQRSLLHLTLARGGLESHAAGHAGHQIAAFGEEREAQLRCFRFTLEIAAQRAKGHISIEIAVGLRFVVNGEDARIELLVVAEEILGHGFVVEPVLGGPHVVVLGLAPIELPARVGAQLEIARVERVGQSEEAVATAVDHLHELTLDEVAVVVPQFAIEHSADAAWHILIGAPRVGREPYCVAQEIRGVVHVHVHLLLRYGLPETPEAVGQALQRRQ